tara:strand:+ start:38506 stop:39102 length:597 start_codon:yes stop_codon:yes gene_type:complete
MIIISHRINSIDLLKSTPEYLGVEIDIRSYGKNLILHHDPFIKGEDFYEWIRYYNHKFLILNVKEEGLEEKLLDIMTSKKIRDFFFLDQSFPFLMKTLNSGVNKCALRLSEYESIKTVLNLSGRAQWIWVDFFNKFPLEVNTIKKLKENNFKICLVSPELQGHCPEVEIPKIIKLLGNNLQLIDAVCTKREELWSNND